MTNFLLNSVEWNFFYLFIDGNLHLKLIIQRCVRISNCISKKWEGYFDYLINFELRIKS